jgi:hypothetical protein
MGGQKLVDKKAVLLELQWARKIRNIENMRGVGVREEVEVHAKA